MSSNDYNLTDAKKFITERFLKNRSTIKSLKVDIAEAVSKAIDADEEFVNTMCEQGCSFSNTDEMEFIRNKTGFNLDFIELLLWYKNCYEMALGMWEYDSEDCLNCGGGPLHFKEITGADYGEKLVCQECGFEMIIGEDGLEKYQD